MIVLGEAGHIVETAAALPVNASLASVMERKRKRKGGGWAVIAELVTAVMLVAAWPSLCLSRDPHHTPLKSRRRVELQLIQECGQIHPSSMSLAFLPESRSHLPPRIQSDNTAHCNSSTNLLATSSSFHCC